MIYRNANGDLVEINKYEYISDQEYMRYILDIKKINLSPKYTESANAYEERSTYIQKFLIENSIKNIDNKNKNNKR